MAIINPDFWIERLRDDVSFAEKMLIKDGRLAPMFFLQSDDGLFVVATPYGNDDEKAHTYRIITMMCVAHDVYGFCSLSEAWMAAIPKIPGGAEEQLRQAAKMRASEAENRIEVIIAMAVYRNAENTRKSISLTREIQRDPNDKFIGLGAETLTNDQHLGGIPNILPMTNFPPAVRSKARETLHNLGIKAEKMPAPTIH